MPVKDTTYHGQITGNVYLRTAPSVTSSKVMVLRKGMKVLATPYNNEWAQVATYVNGISRTGYASMKYIKSYENSTTKSKICYQVPDIFAIFCVCFYCATICQLYDYRHGTDTTY